MAETITMQSGGYDYIPGVFQYSAGVAARPGYRIIRVQFTKKPLTLRQGFDTIAALLRGRQRPLQAFCACELRSPEPFSETGFRTFNEDYASVLKEWDIMQDDRNPVARSNVCPEFNAPATPSFHAFCFTEPTAEPDASFVIAGSGEAPEGRGNYRDHIVRLNDTSAAGIHAKAEWVIGEMARRMAAFDRSWPDTTAVQLYTVFDAFPVMRDQFSQHGVLTNGVTWHFNRPPVAGIDFEMDCRRILNEEILPLS